MALAQPAADPFTREEETRMCELAQRAEAGDTLTEHEVLELAKLKRRYHTFIEEGERRLRAGAPGQPRPRAPGGGNGSPGAKEGAEGEWNASATLARAGKAAYFWGSLAATALPGYVGRVAGVTTDFLHWNWITEHVVLGAIPVVTQVGGGGDHLKQLRAQLDERGQRLGMVVACLEEEELNGFGMNVIEFAKEADWRKVVNPDLEYVHLPMADTTAGTPLPSVAETVMKMDEYVTRRKETVYVHCKAGKGRSWMVVMNYLVTLGGMAYGEAAEIVQQKRVQVNPSPSQKKFVEQFPFRFSRWRAQHCPVAEEE